MVSTCTPHFLRRCQRESEMELSDKGGLQDGFGRTIRSLPNREEKNKGYCPKVSLLLCSSLCNH